MDPKPAKRYPKMKCIVPECNYKERMFPKYHEFPKDPERRGKWIEFCKVIPLPRIRAPFDAICDKHFLEEDYKPMYRILGRAKKEWRLMDNAVPSLFGPDRNNETVTQEGGGEMLMDRQQEYLGMNTEEVPENQSVLKEEYGEEEEIQEVLIPGECRLCLSSVDTHESFELFQEMEGQESISQSLVSYLQIELGQFHGWPSLVCGHCVTFIRQMRSFKEMVLSVQEKLAEVCINVPVPVEVQSTKTEEEDRIPLPEEFNAEDTIETPVWNEEDSDDIPLKSRKVFAKKKVAKKIKKPRRDLSKKMDATVDNKPAVPEKSFKCSGCDKVFKERFRLNQHEVHHLPKDQRPCKCEYCELRFANKGQLKRHVERVHEIEERHVCELCGKGFSSKPTFWDHFKYTHKSKPPKG